MWAEKEMHNLMKMSKFGIPVPEVILLKKHVLVIISIWYGQMSIQNIENVSKGPVRLVAMSWVWHWVVQQTKYSVGIYDFLSLWQCNRLQHTSDR